MHVRIHPLFGLGLALLGGVGLLKLHTLNRTVIDLVGEDWPTARTAIDLRSNFRSLAARTMEFLLADEAGTSPLQRAALQDPQFTETAVTKAFSGRYARGLRNRFMVEHEQQAPLAYPQVHYLTSPVRAAAARAGDPHGTNVWAGSGFRMAVAAPVATIVGALWRT